MAILTPNKPVAGNPRGIAKGLADRVGFVGQMLNRPLASYYLVLISAMLLLSLGMVMVLSASSVFASITEKDSYYYAKRQVVFLVAGFLAAWWIARTKPSVLRGLGWIGIVVSFVFLLLTFTPLGYDAGKGNQNWVQFGTSLFRIQPSEFAKLAIIVWGADILSRKDKLLDQPRHLLVPFVPVSGVLIGLVILQKDLGTAMVMGAILVAILWMVGAPWRVLAGLGGVVAVAVAGLVLSSGNRMGRILGFMNPDTNLDGVNQQPLRGIYALASGGWFGLGLGASRQKWGMLVEAHTDYVFAIIGEEMGLFGTLAVLALFLTLGYAGLRIALRSDQLFCRYASAGVTAWFMIQALVNVAVVLRLIPVLGVPLPLVSYGGSALLANLCALGVLISCARQEPAARRLLEKRKGKGPKPRLTTVIERRRRA